MLCTISVAIIMRWLMDSSVCVCKLRPGTEVNDVLMNVFPFFLRCYLLFSACNCKQLFYQQLTLKQQLKNDPGFFLVRWHTETISRAIHCDYHTSDCRGAAVVWFERFWWFGVCRIIFLGTWLTDKPWMTQKSCCDLVSSRNRKGQRSSCSKANKIIFLFFLYLVKKLFINNSILHLILSVFISVHQQCRYFSNITLGGRDYSFNVEGYLSNPFLDVISWTPGSGWEDVRISFPKM